VSCINKRLLCPSLASTLRNPVLPKAVSKRKYAGLHEPNFDEDVEKKRPDAGKEYDPEGDYIYDARKYFNPEKYREIIANQEEKKKKEQQTQKKFYYRAFRSHRRHSWLNTHSGLSSVNYVGVRRDRFSATSSLLNSEYQYPIYDVSKLQSDDSHLNSHHKKAKKKSKHSKHHNHTLEASSRSSKRKKSDDKKHKKKRKRNKSDDRRSKSLSHNHEYHCDKRRTKLRHRSRQKSKLFLSQQQSPAVTNCDYSDSFHCMEQNSLGNDCDSSDPPYLSDDSVSGSNSYQHLYVDKNAVSDSDRNASSFVNYAERRVIAGRMPRDDVCDEDSSASSEYCRVNKEFSPNDEENDHDEDMN